MSKIKVAIIGFGNIGKKYFDILGRFEEIKIAAICDSDQSKLQDLPLQTYSSIDQFHALEKEIDLACICTPNGFHTEHGILCLKNGMHIICEKPMGLSAESCKKLIEAKQISGKEIFCVMQNRYSPPAKWLKELIENKTLGKIYQVHINCFWNRG